MISLLVYLEAVASKNDPKMSGGAFFIFRGHILQKLLQKGPQYSIFETQGTTEVRNTENA